MELIISAEYDDALIFVINDGHLEIVRYLVEQGAVFHAENEAALRIASETGHLEIVKSK